MITKGLHDRVMEKVSSEGNVIGFSVLKANAPKEHPALNEHAGVKRASVEVALGSD